MTPQQLNKMPKMNCPADSIELRQKCAAKISIKLFNRPSSSTSSTSSTSQHFSTPFLLLATFAIWLCLIATTIPHTNAMPLQMLRMYSKSGQMPSILNGNPAIYEYLKKEHRPHALLSRKYRQLSNEFLAEEGAKIRHQIDEQQQKGDISSTKRANEFEVEPAEEEEKHNGFRDRDLLLNPAEEAQQKQREHLPAEQREHLPAEMGDEDDEESAVLAAAAAAGLLRQERNEPNAAVPKMYARHIGDLGGTMFRFG